MGEVEIEIKQSGPLESFASQFYLILTCRFMRVQVDVLTALSGAFGFNFFCKLKVTLFSESFKNENKNK